MSTATAELDPALLQALEGPTEELFSRHMGVTKTWYPGDFTPDRILESGQPWDEQVYPLRRGIRGAVFVNLLTEDNLPYYTDTLHHIAGPDHPFSGWIRRWTAEEGRHALAIRDWAVASGALDDHMLEDARMQQVSGGVVPRPTNLINALTYASFQEQATNVAHRNTGRMLGKERGGSKVMAVVAGDETLHANFYRDLAGKALEFDPSTVVLSAAETLRRFKMPGTGIPDFERHTEAIALEGIFGANELVNEVFVPTLKSWDYWNLTGLSDEANIARDKSASRLGAYGRAIEIERQAREAFQAELRQTT